MAAAIEVVTAAAGAGKTTRIVGDIAAYVTEQPPEQLVATTFTIRAADELVERTRARLFADGRADEASRVLGARFGTVNAVCGQIVAEHALELGRSPATRVIDETVQPLVFSVAASAAIGTHAPELNDLAEAFGHDDPRPPDQPSRADWRKIVRDLLALARANGLRPADLAASAERSVAGFLALFPPAADGVALEAALARALDDALALAPAVPSRTAQRGVANVRSAAMQLRRGRSLTWSMWARLSKTAAARTRDGGDYADAVAALTAAAGRHAQHPQQRADGERFIRLVFACAAEALEAYQGYKAERGLLDFVDQEALALEVLGDPALADRLRERIRRVFVDEFQDSSPLQLAVFSALAELVEASTWVGDPKQAIYAFRGADTGLTQAAFAGVAGLVDPADALTVSHRSRREIIEFVNAAFEPAFARMGVDAARNAFSDTTRNERGFDRRPMAFWPLIGSTLVEQADALAQGVRRALDEADDWLVGEREAEPRALRAGDIAVLCRTNLEVARIAAALNRAGLAVAVEREGLARTPHVELALAAYRYIVDPTDRLALAEMARFFADNARSDAWLRAAAADDPVAALLAELPVAPGLLALHERRHELTPAGLLDGVLALPDLIGRIERWGDAAMRLDDLEALRGFVRAYEAEADAAGAPATPHGFLLAIAEDEAPRPPSLDSSAVQVLTYHGAKGLEWPLVILSGLAWEPRPRFFEPVVETDGQLDWRAPLKGRWLRFWPWPYGPGGAGSAIDLAAAQSAVGQGALRRSQEEETRLLYVGMTRARDYLVLAPPAGSACTWLRVLDNDDGTPRLGFPPPDDNLLRAGDETFVATVWPLQAAMDGAIRTPAITHVSARAARPAMAPLHLRPSEASGDGSWRIAERVTLGARLPLTGAPDMTALGEALHAVLAYDDVSRPRAQRLADAAATFKRWEVTALSGDDAIEAADRFFRQAAMRWPGDRLIREVPVSAKLGDQLVHGRIDLLVERPGAFALVDHKSFPGRLQDWDGKALSYAPQLALYADAVCVAAGTRCEELWIHLPVVGALLRVERPLEA